jgi:hypothetical protein
LIVSPGLDAATAAPIVQYDGEPVTSLHPGELSTVLTAASTEPMGAAAIAKIAMELSSTRSLFLSIP